MGGRVQAAWAKHRASRLIPNVPAACQPLASRTDFEAGYAAAKGEFSRRFNAGYLIAVANIMNLHGDDVIAKDVLQELGVKASVLKGMDLTDYDLKPLRRLFREIKP